MAKTLKSGSSIDVLVDGWLAKGWCTEEQAMNFVDDLMQIVTIDDGHMLQFLSKEGVRKAIAVNVSTILSAVGSAIIIACAAGLGTLSAVHTLLDNINIETLPATVISQSSYNGYSSESSIGL